MRTSERSRWWLALVAVLSSGCLHAKHGAPELVGRWTTSTTAPDGVHGTTATYDFKDDGSFEMSGYPPIEVKGRWRVVERAPSKLRLELTEQRMTHTGGAPSPWNDEQDWAELADSGRSFRYRGKVFNKNEPAAH